VNATSIVVGGSTAKQIDCGSIATSSYSGGAFTISFNFTFSNIPKVVTTTAFNASTYLCAIQITSVSTTGFSGNVNQIVTGSSTINTSGVGLNWIAIG